MAYERQEWKNGDIITSEKLNHMEDGIESVDGGLVATATYDDDLGISILDKTWKEVHDAMVAGKTCIIHSSLASGYEDVLTVANTRQYPLIGEPAVQQYEVVVLDEFRGSFISHTYFATSENGYLQEFLPDIDEH